MHRYKILDIYRGMAALFVFFYHIRYQINLVDVFENFWIFTDFFFVLSGFIISYNYKFIHNINDFFSFIKKRFLRIYPLHFIITIIFLLKYVIIDDQLEITSFLNNIFLLNSIHYDYINLYNQPSWSISAEFIIYIFFAFYLFISTKFNLKIILALFIVVLFVSLTFILNQSISETNNLAFIRCGVSFFYGLSVELFFREKKSITSLLIFFIFFIFFGLFFKLSTYYIIIYFFGIIIHITKHFEIRNTYVIRFLHLLGSISYSLYMLQSILIYIFVVAFGSKWQISHFIFILITLIITSYISYNVIENKLTQKLKKLL